MLIHTYEKIVSIIINIVEVSDIREDYNLSYITVELRWYQSHVCKTKNLSYPNKTIVLTIIDNDIRS